MLKKACLCSSHSRVEIAWVMPKYEGVILSKIRSWKM